MAGKTRIYEKGTVKAVWIEPGTGERIYSKMFDSEPAAVEFARGKQDYVIYSLVRQKKMTDFEWILLPYGRHRIYIKLMKIYWKHKSAVLKLFEIMDR